MANRYDSDARFVSAAPTRDTEAQWRVVGELLNEQSSNPHAIVDTMRGIDVAPRILGKDENPLLRGQGFAITSIPFTIIIITLVVGVVTLAFTDAQFFGWLMTGIGALGLIVLTVVYALNERNSPGAVDRHWSNTERHKHDNDTTVRLEMVKAERDVRLARLQVYRETQLQIGVNADEPVRRIAQNPKQLTG